MKINLSYPATGCQKLVEIADELKVRKETARTPGREKKIYFPIFLRSDLSTRSAWARRWRPTPSEMSSRATW